MTDLTKLFKLHTPTIDAPVPRFGIGLGDGVGVISEFQGRLPEFIRPIKYLLVGAGLTAGDLVGHQFFPALEGGNTPKGYYGSLFLFSIPALIIGRATADLIPGTPPMLKAVIIGTVANLAMQVRYLFGGFAKGFNMTNFLIHEALLVPLSILIAGDNEAITVVASKENA